MKQWKTALIAASPAFLLLLLLLVILAMVFCHSRKLFLHGRGNNDMGNRGGYRNHGNGGVNCINVGMKKKKKGYIYLLVLLIYRLHPPNCTDAYYLESTHHHPSCTKLLNSL